MELASQDSIRALLPGCGSPAQVRVRRRVQDVNQLANKCRKMRCRCGQCHQCLDDARWVRIFAAKFEDPTYYNRPMTRMTSPLTSL